MSPLGRADVGIEDQIREIEAAKAAEDDRARLEERDSQARVVPANELLRRLSQEAFRSLQSRNKGLGLEVELHKRFGSCGIRTGRRVWLLPEPSAGASISHVGFLDDGTPVWANPLQMPPSAGQVSGGIPSYKLPKIRRRVESAVRAAGCVVPIAPVRPIVAEGAPPVAVVATAISRRNTHSSSAMTGG
jgi:hypothetical protein